MALRSDLGSIIRTRRRETGTQTAVAISVGITAESLSRIENGHAVPFVGTLDTLLDVLRLEWADVAIPVAPDLSGATRRYSRRRDHLLDQGAEIRLARRRAGLTLRDLSREAGISIAQLSRVERGESGGALIYADHPDDLARPRDERRILHTNPILAELVQTWGGEDGDDF